MNAQQQLYDWLRLAFSYRVGSVSFLKLLQVFETPTKILAQSETSLSAVVGVGLAKSILSSQGEAAAHAALDWLAKAPATRHLITLNDADYPVELAQIAQPPLLLFAEGELKLLTKPKLAIVGSRHPSAQGIENAHAFSAELAAAGLVIVSGLASGIDRAAHEGALKHKNATIGVIGTGIDVLYPSSNRDLYQQLRQNGLILSEFALGTPPLNVNFPRRNRIIVGLSLGCLVVESAIDGGSMISANLALEMGREVFAIPGSIHNPMARGCHKLIKQGAKLCETALDIQEELQLGSNSLKQSVQQEVIEDPILLAMGYDPLSLDELCIKLNCDFGLLCGKLLEFELSGLVINCGNGRYQRIFK